jgi:TM2 domain-containing membrane protein YozV
MANVLQLMPRLEGEELTFVQTLIKDMDDAQAQLFASVYNARRRDPMLILLTALLGFIIVAGVHRFILGQIGMGILYLFTAGLCFIGTIVDLVNHKRLAFEYNARVAQEVATTVRASNP